METDDIVRKVRAALEYEPRVNLHRYPIRAGYADGAVVLDGEKALQQRSSPSSWQARWEGRAACWTACALRRARAKATARSGIRHTHP
jgi:hypothetical protein